MELMVVLAVVAILGFAVYPWLSNVREVLMVKGAAENVAAAIRMARQLAITQGTNHCIEFGAGQYRIRQADTTPACTGAVVSGYDWQSLSDERDGRDDRADPCSSIRSGIGSFRAGVSGTIFTVDTSPSSCINTITVTLYGGVRVAGC